MRVLISAAGSPASVSILRHVRSLGHEVVGMNADPQVATLARAFCDTFHLAPHANSAGYLDFLRDRLGEVDIFLPFIDEELVTIATGWSDLPPALAAKIAVSEPSVLLDCVDKCRFQRLCAQAGIPIAPEATAPPAFFKPRFGRGGKGVVAALDDESFRSIKGREGVVQRAIRGNEYTVDAVFGRNGVLLATAARRRMRAVGVSTIGEVGWDERLHQLAESLGRTWRFRYAINFQVIRDGSGQDWVIELNPRLAGSAIFSTLAGCDPIGAALAIWRGETWHGHPRPLRVWRYWQEMACEP